MSKRAQTLINMIEILWKVFIVILIIVIMVIIIFYYLNEKINTDEIQMQLLFTKFATSSDCLAVKDKPNIINLDKFYNQELLGTCIVNPKYGVILKLMPLKPAQAAIPEIKLGHPNKAQIASACAAYKKIYPCSKKTLFVNYFSEGQIKPAILQMEAAKDVEE